MKLRIVITMSFALAACGGQKETARSAKFEPTFESLQTANAVPEWFKDAKLGIYFHWGVYSVPAFANEWYPRHMYVTNSSENVHHRETYGEPSDWPYHNFIIGANDKKGNFVKFAPKLKSEGGNFDPEEWAQLFADAGARFAGPVAEHHDGISMWASKVNPWNVNQMGPGLDLVGLLTGAIRKKDMKVVLSMHHAFNITGFYDRVPPTNDAKLQILYGQLGQEKNESLWLSKHKEIIDNYKPDIIWQDFNLHKISQPVLLEFLSYYYNRSLDWNKEVVATYKDGLNTKCAVLDYERGGPTDLTDNYWLTDDAISSSSWCYTEGIGYYSKKQVLHGFLDRISKNGNLLLNISPMADGSIPREQKDILLSMGSWLKKYGEAVYATRAWDIYGEGPTKMGAAHGVFQAPAEGTNKDIRFTRSKDNSTLYAILLGWDKDQKQATIASLSSDRIDIQSLESVGLIGDAGTLRFKQDENGLVVELPDRPSEDLAYVIKLKFKDHIPPVDRSAVVDTTAHYYLIPGHKTDSLALGNDLALSKRVRSPDTQWKLVPVDKGLYNIVSRRNGNVLGLDNKDSLDISTPSKTDEQVWRLEKTFYGLLRITNKRNPQYVLAPANSDDSFIGWQLQPSCEEVTKPFKPLVIPGTIEAEDFNSGCHGEAYFDQDEINASGLYRVSEPVDIENNDAGGYNVRFTPGEWLTYKVNVQRSGTYKVSFNIACSTDDAKLHLLCDGADQPGIIPLPLTGDRQNWTLVTKTLKLEKGEHLLKLVVNGYGVNIDRIVFGL